MKKNFFSKASLALLVASSMGGAVMASAATTPGTDPTTDRTLTIHANGGNSDQANAGQNKTGENNDSMNGVNPIKNITFSATQIQPTGSAADMDVTDTSTYSIVGTPKSGTTDETGTVKLDFGTDNDGYYIIHQVTESDGITQMKDFIVQIPLNLSGVTDDGGWNYDVNVYPKLDADQDSGSDKTVGGFDDDTDKQGSVFAGQDVTWNLATVFSKTMRAKNDDGFIYGKFVLTDQLNKDLAYKSIDFSVGIQNTTDNKFSKITKVSLEKDKDYNLSYTGDTDGYGGKVVLTLTNSGIDKVLDNYITPGENERFMFIPNMTTTVSPNFGYGQIGNSFSGDIDNAFDTDLGFDPANPDDPNTPPGTNNPPTETPEVYLGAVRIKKVDSVSKNTLAGATFAIATSEENAKAGKYAQIADDGTVYATIDEVPEGITTKDYLVISGEDGIAEFDGLELTDFQTPGNGTDVSQANTSYWLKETQAPKGYDLIPNAFEVQASIDPSTVVSDVDNNLGGGNIDLPFTGGHGLLTLVIVGGVTLTGGTLLTLRRRKNTAE